MKCKDWVTHKKKKANNQNNSNNGATAQFAGVCCSRYIGVQKRNTCVCKSKHAKNLSMKELILLDSDSSASVACNKRYVSNSCRTANAMHAETNRDVTTANQKCCMPNIGEHWFSKKFIANILSLRNIANEHKVAVGAHKEKAFNGYFLRKIVRFKQLSNRSHRIMPSDLSSCIEYPAVLKKDLNFYKHYE